MKRSLNLPSKTDFLWSLMKFIERTFTWKENNSFLLEVFLKLWVLKLETTVNWLPLTQLQRDCMDNQDSEEDISMSTTLTLKLSNKLSNWSQSTFALMFQDKSLWIAWLILQLVKITQDKLKKNILLKEKICLIPLRGEPKLSLNSWTKWKMSRLSR